MFSSYTRRSRAAHSSHCPLIPSLSFLTRPLLIAPLHIAATGPATLFFHMRGPFSVYLVVHLTQSIHLKSGAQQCLNSYLLGRQLGESIVVICAPSKSILQMRTHNTIITKKDTIVPRAIYTHAPHAPSTSYHAAK